MNMLFFQSEEWLNEWLISKRVERGAVLSVPQLWDLSQRWYQDRLSPEFHGRTAEQVQRIFRELGLTSEFWQAS
jgi:hypothetical protein